MVSTRQLISFFDASKNTRMHTYDGKHTQNLIISRTVVECIFTCVCTLMNVCLSLLTRRYLNCLKKKS